MAAKYTVGKGVPSWRDTNVQTITFVVTEDCNLRCKYCYITHKASNKKMSYEVAKEFIDYILTANIHHASAVILEFIGGEPLIEVELVDRICDYFKLRAYELQHQWYWNYCFSFSTNGVNYSSEEVQKFIEKNLGKISIGISIDGNRKKHDLQRIFPDGSGSYNVIEQSIPLWIKQFRPATKVTFASEDLPLLKDSVLDLWSKGITDVSANVVYENVWKEQDDVIFENQLRYLADYILENKLFDKYYCSFFSDSIGGYLTREARQQTYCGAGKMLAIGPEGTFYPCIRYKDYSLNNKPERLLGNTNVGIDMEKVRPFIVSSSQYQDDSECQNCPVATGCGQCQGFSYDMADTDTNFQRSKFICKMHKARVRANDYYFSKLFNLYDIKKDITDVETARMYFLLSDDYQTYCCYNNELSCNNEHIYKMKSKEVLAGLHYCREKFFNPIFVHSANEFDYVPLPEFEDYHILHIISIKFFEQATQYFKDVLYVFDKNTVCLDLSFLNLSTCILNVESNDIAHLEEYVRRLFPYVNRINVNVLGLDSNFDENIYEKELSNIESLLTKEYKNTVKELNLITDLLNLRDWNNCKAGDRSFIYAPNAMFYPCSGLYSSQMSHTVGDIKNGINRLQNPKLYLKAFNPLCNVCDTLQCQICIYINQIATKELNVSPSYQCRKSHIEREISLKYQKDFEKETWINQLEAIDYRDPITQIPKIKDGTDMQYSYYTFKK